MVFILPPDYETLPAVNKYAGAVWSDNRARIYFVPFSAGNVGKTNPATQTFSTFGVVVGTQQYAGGVLNAAGTVMYCMPYDATQVLKVDLVAETLSLIGPALGATSGKWCGGVYGADGLIYGIPYNSTELLEINPATDSVNTVADANIAAATAPRWAGGALHPNGKIYCAPASIGNRVLIINTGVATTAAFCSKAERNKF